MNDRLSPPPECAPAEAPLHEGIEVSVVMPCLNERDSIAGCIQRAARVLQEHNLCGEIVVCDNGSSDDSAEIARSCGARVVQETLRGYGAAYMKGIAAARGRLIVIGDSDMSYDFGEMPRLLEALRQGYDLALGSRLRGTILPGAMPWAHRHIGNPILTGMLNVLFGLRVSDAHTGLRAFSRAAYERMQLQATGMEFASEMVIKASLVGLKVTERPITYHPRGGRSKLSPLWDAWRHVRFMLLFSPTHLFLVPGVAALLAGLALQLALARGPLRPFGWYVGIHYMVVGSLLAVLGVQLLSFGLSARLYAISERFVGGDRWVRAFLRCFSLERGLLVGTLLVVVGMGMLVHVLAAWLTEDPLRFNRLIHLHEAMLASTLTIIGVQVVIAAFFFSLLGLHRRQHSSLGESPGD